MLQRLGPDQVARWEDLPQSQIDIDHHRTVANTQQSSKIPIRYV